MKIEDVEKLADELDQMLNDFKVVHYHPVLTAITALRAEAWQPIEKADELGAKDGRWLLVWDGPEWWDVFWHTKKGGWWIASDKPLYAEPTHFRFINPPE